MSESEIDKLKAEIEELKMEVAFARDRALKEARSEARGYVGSWTQNPVAETRDGIVRAIERLMEVK